jgi:hypothetical protein
MLKQKAGMAPTHFSPRFTARRFRSIEVKGEMAAPPVPGTPPNAIDALRWTPVPQRR